MLYPFPHAMPLGLADAMVGGSRSVAWCVMGRCAVAVPPWATSRWTDENFTAMKIIGALAHHALLRLWRPSARGGACGAGVRAVWPPDGAHRGRRTVAYHTCMTATRQWRGSGQPGRPRARWTSMPLDESRHAGAHIHDTHNVCCDLTGAPMPHGMDRRVVCSSQCHVLSPTRTFRRIHAYEKHETVGGLAQSLWL